MIQCENSGDMLDAFPGNFALMIVETIVRLKRGDVGYNVTPFGCSVDEPDADGTTMLTASFSVGES